MPSCRINLEARQVKRERGDRCRPGADPFSKRHVRPDLPAIEALEEALAKCPCGLLLVSHDYRFLSRLVRKRWHLESAQRDVHLRIMDEFRCPEE
jgi:hypothetical protein